MKELKEVQANSLTGTCCSLYDAPLKELIAKSPRQRPKLRKCDEDVKRCELSLEVSNKYQVLDDAESKSHIEVVDKIGPFGGIHCVPDPESGSLRTMLAEEMYF